MGRAKREMSLGLPLLQHPDVRCRSDAAKKRISSLSKPSTCLLLVFLLATASTTCCQEAARKSLACQGLAFLRLPAALLVFGIRNHTVQLKAGALCRSCNGNSILTAGPLSKDVLSMGQRQLRETSRRNEAGSIPDETRGRLLGTLHGQDLSDIALLEGHGERAELGFEAKLSKLVTLNFGFEDLSHSQRGGVSQFQSLACEGQECPSFLPCPRSALADTSSEAAIGSCSNSELVDSQLELNFKEKNRAPSAYVELDPCPDNAERWSVGRLISPRCPNPNVLGKRNVEAEGFKGSSSWSGQVLLLRNVFVTWDGLVFNETHFFFTGGCNANSAALSFPSTTKVVRKAAAVNLLQSHDGHARMVVHREIIDKLPLLLSLAPIMPSLKGRGAVFLADSKFLRHVAFHFSGLELAEMGVSLPSKDHLFFVEVLIQPFLQPCLYPSPALWRSFRSRHLLPPNGLPMFNPDWTYRKMPPVNDRLGSNSENGTSGMLLPGDETPPISLLGDWIYGSEEEEGVAGEDDLLPNLSGPDFSSNGSTVGSVPRDWLVVVARNPQWVLRELTTILGTLRRRFGRRRVVGFEDNLSISDARALFRRTVFFVTMHGIGVSNVMFMPPNAIMLDLRQGPAQSKRRKTKKPEKGIDPQIVEDVVLVRNLAEACEVRHFALFCERASAYSSCNLDQVKEVIDRAAAAVFTSPAARAAAVAAAGDFSGLIPGSRLKSREQVEAFKSWMGCISREGSWQYDPTPRILPWSFDKETSMCDDRHAAHKWGVAYKSADAIVRQKLPPKKWTVRESLKYRWRVPTGRCPYRKEKQTWSEFSVATFCEKIGRGRTILFVGDSLTKHTAKSLVNGLLMSSKPLRSAFTDVRPAECRSGHKSFDKDDCREFVFGKETCRGLKIRLVRNDHVGLHLDGDRQRNFNWARAPFISDADIIFMNRGAHYSPDEDFEKGVRDAMAYIRYRYPKKIVIFRTTPPGHVNCSTFSAPIAEPQNKAFLPFHWDEFHGQNRKVLSFAEEYGVVVMDVDYMTSLRADGHIGLRSKKGRVFSDCLHYCTPGPIDTWILFFYNILLKLLHT